MTNRYAVIGQPVSHSMSPAIHELFAAQFGMDITYERILGDVSNFEQQVDTFFFEGGLGLNVTLPFKERAFHLSTERTHRCLAARAANTLWVKNGILHADNTDGIGFIRDLGQFFSVKGRSVLILGAGGAARGLIQPLLDEQPERLMIWNRTEDKLQALVNDFPELVSVQLNQLEAVDCIINATSASVSGSSLELPLPIWQSKPFCYDLAYDVASPTSFVALARRLGCRAVDGFGMLVEQAAESFYIWNGRKPDTSRVVEALLPDAPMATRNAMRS